ncbi:hypothetical protein LTR78_001186 [Recurvomyces mirabilis]|uniref:Uncharacterized protein n=1 Tax=Recurvomyces mirabilis TaxID=574656 RepID=A0AAE1C5D5_9PEZI|nr:hypothetical protein LTR78_001186 [Recurvomyces mirabilis]KAK5161162.1 hypothetical protein LTS14_000958 [Recurvomyces mirabilis]
MAETSIVIQRKTLNTSPDARLNSYDHHSRAPWLEGTGYLTPLYLYHREQALLPFHVAHWMTSGVEPRMLAQPSWIIDVSRDQIEGLLTLAAKIDYNRDKHGEIWAELSDIVQSFPYLPWSTTGHFVRMSSCSFKDLDHRFLKATYGIRGAMLKLVHSKATEHSLLNLLDREDFVLDNKLNVFPFIPNSIR